MDNYHFIKRASRKKLAKIINLLINKGSQTVSDELWNATHVVDHGDNQKEAEEWLMLNTLEKRYK